MGLPGYNRCETIPFCPVEHVMKLEGERKLYLGEMVELGHQMG
jgi:hypothetical protein